MSGAAKPSGLIRFWKIPFLVGWIAAILLLKLRMDQAVLKGTLTSDPTTGHIYKFAQDQTYYITANEHFSLLYFEIGIAVFALCYIISSFATAGSNALWRFLPIDDKDIDPANRRFAVIVTSIGAAFCLAGIVVSYMLR